MSIYNRFRNGLSRGSGINSVDIALDSVENIAAFSAPLDVKDGITLTSGTSRILLTNQGTVAENGVWIYQGDGSPLTRPVDYNTNNNIFVGDTIVVRLGTFENSHFILTNTTNTDNRTVIIDTDGSLWHNITNQDFTGITQNLETLSRRARNGDTRVRVATGTSVAVNDWLNIDGNIRQVTSIDINTPNGHDTINFSTGLSLDNRLNIGEQFYYAVENQTGKRGYVPAPTSQNVGQILTADGQWSSSDLHIIVDEISSLIPVEIALNTNEDIASFSAPLNMKDGVTLVSGTSRILLTGQTDASQNGVWIYNGDTMALTRASDYGAGESLIIGANTIVKNGTNKGAKYILSETNNADNETVLVDTDNTTWTVIESLTPFDNIYEEKIIYTATLTAGTNITLPVDSRDSGSMQFYTNGSGELEVYLNGQVLQRGDDFTENGTAGSTQNQIQMTFDLVDGDELLFRIGQYGTVQTTMQPDAVIQYSVGMTYTAGQITWDSTTNTMFQVLTGFTATTVNADIAAGNIKTMSIPSADIFTDISANFTIDNQNKTLFVANGMTADITATFDTGLFDGQEISIINSDTEDVIITAGTAAVVGNTGKIGQNGSRTFVFRTTASGGGASGTWYVVEEIQDAYTPPTEDFSINGEIITADNRTYTLELSAAAAYTINSLIIQTGSGNCTAELQINGVAVTGIAAVAANTTLNTYTATAANTVAVDDTVTLVISANASATDVVFTVRANG